MEFRHIQTAHCESGVTASLLSHSGWNISEPMVFGVGSGIFFIHLPFLKLHGIPGTSYRIWPGGIFKRTSKLLGVHFEVRKFKNSKDSMEALDDKLKDGVPVGVMGSVFYLTYLPDAYRFHFNAHNLVVFGKEGDEYLISDPVLAHTTRIHRDDLIKARFAKGYPEPSGTMYYIKELPSQEIPDLKNPIKKGINRTSFLINSAPFPFIGTKGIGYLAKKIRSYPDKLTERQALLYLGNIIRMQEEIGTGGAGFRFMYAAFLQQAGQNLRFEPLELMSIRMTEIGDLWRDFAFSTARVIKSRSSDKDMFGTIADKLQVIGDKEVSFFRDLSKLKFI